MEQKRGEGKQRFKKGGQSGSGGGCLKKGDWNPLTNYGFHSTGNITISSNFSAQIYKYKTYRHDHFCFHHLIGNNDVSTMQKLTDLTDI